jgi:hypothetical protein
MCFDVWSYFGYFVIVSTLASIPFLHLVLVISQGTKDETKQKSNFFMLCITQTHIQIILSKTRTHIIFFRLAHNTQIVPHKNSQTQKESLISCPINIRNVWIFCKLLENCGGALNSDYIFNKFWPFKIHNETEEFTRTPLFATQRKIYFCLAIWSVFCSNLKVSTKFQLKQ